MWNAASRQFFLNQAKPYPYATGGDYVYLYQEGNKTYRVHEFLSTGTSTLEVEVGGQMDVFIVAGGGGGSGHRFGNPGGGGGAGGKILNTNVNVAAGSYSVTVGAGGLGSAGNSNTYGEDGATSAFSDWEATGGGAGGYATSVGRNGGSGGGGSSRSSGGSGIVGQGYDGGDGYYVNSVGVDTAGGGGGASEAGHDGFVGDVKDGTGGAGVEWPSGSGNVYAEGGDGGRRNEGGDGDDALPNTGSGGGGGDGSGGGTRNGGDGGSGIVIVRYVVAEKTLWTPSELGSIKAWWDASDESTVTLSSSRVTQINDKSGNSLNLSNSGSTGPTLTTNGLNGLPTMTFTGSEWLSASSAADWKFLHDGTENTVISVVKFGTSSNPNEVYGILGTSPTTTSLVGYAIGYDDRSAFSYNDVASFFITNGGARTAVQIDTNNNVLSEFANRITPNQQNILTHLADPSDATAANRIKVSVNGDVPKGNNIYTNAPSSSNPAYTLQLGAYSNGTAPLKGTISEVVIFTEKVDDETRRKLEGYLAHKWGLTNNLPSGHPYKYEPPYKVEPEEIVTDGLVLNLDAGDYASYPRSGTTWYDISGNGNNGTLTNGPTYDSANKGSIVFDGTNDYVAVGNDSSNQITTSLTLEAWVYPTQFDHTNIKEVIAKWDNRQYKLAIAGTIFGVPYGRFYIDVSDTGSNDNYRRSSSTLTLNSWNHIVGVYTSGASPSLNVYLNGTLDNGNLVGSVPSSIYNGTSPVYIGSHGGRAFKGNIANVRIYNRALSSTEIQQNFNALRGRYGV